MRWLAVQARLQRSEPEPESYMANFYAYILVVTVSYLSEALFVGLRQSSVRALFSPRNLQPEYFCFYFPIVFRKISLWMGLAWINLFVRLDIVPFLFFPGYQALFPLPFLPGFVLALLLHDFCRYWVHW